MSHPLGAPGRRLAPSVSSLPIAIAALGIAGCVAFGLKPASTNTGVSTTTTSASDGSTSGGSTSTGSTATTGSTSTSTSQPVEETTSTGTASDAGSVFVAPPSVALPLAVGESHACSLSPTGQVRCWGYNMQGQLGVGSTQHPASGVVSGIGDASDGPVRAIAAGGYQTCALTDRKRVWCWGQNHEGQVGSGEATDAPVRTPTLVRGLSDVARLELGDTTSCALTTAGALFCWGDNSHAQIDDSGERRRLTPTRVSGIDRPDAVSVGNYHLCSVRGGRVSCRGTLTRVASAIAALDEVTAIASGWEHACVLRRGVPLCFGRSYLGVLGAGRVCPLGTSTNCDADVFYPPAAVPGVSGAVAIDGHDYHSCVRLADGTVTCWGNNQGHAFSDTLPAEPFQTAHPVPALGTVDALLVGGTHLCGLRRGAVVCVGNDGYGVIRGATER